MTVNGNGGPFFPFPGARLAQSIELVSVRIRHGV
jgi:hypothetical protein